MLMEVRARRRSDVLEALPTIRLLFSLRGFEVDAYGDDTLVEVLVDTCPAPSGVWLSRQHCEQVVRGLQGSPAVRPVLNAGGAGLELD
jgi:hypothetical protein